MMQKLIHSPHAWVVLVVVLATSIFALRLSARPISRAMLSIATSAT